MARRIIVEFLGQDKSLGSTAASVDSKTSRLGNTLKKVGKVAAIGLAAGAAVAAKGLYDMAKAAAEDEASQKALETTLKNTTGASKQQVAAVEDWISKQGVALGVADDELRPAMQRLAEATGDVGQAQKLASLAMDVSAGTGKSLKTVSEALMKAQNGQVAGLSKLGIETKNAKGETLTFEQATRKMADTFQGQAAAKADTFAGKMGRLRLVFDETKETIGAKLLPIVTRLGTWFLNEGLPAISRFGGWFKENLLPILKDVGQFVGGVLVNAFKQVTGWFKQSGGGMDQLRGAFKSAQPFFVLAKGIFKALGVVLADVLLPIVLKLAKYAIPAIGTALNLVGRAGTWLWNKALQPTFKFIVKGIGWLLEKWGGMLRSMSKVPGFGWAAEAGRKMQEAGRDAQRLAEKIRDIPTSKDIRITYHETTIRSIIKKQAGDPRLDGARAAGGPVRAHGAYLVGEQGPELFVPNQPGMVVNADGTTRIAGDGRRTTARGAAGSTEEHTTVVVLQLDGREIHRALVKRKRTLGAPLGLA